MATVAKPATASTENDAESRKCPCLWADEPWHDEMLRLEYGDVDVWERAISPDHEPDFEAIALFIGQHNWQNPVTFGYLAEHFAEMAKSEDARADRNTWAAVQGGYEAMPEQIAAFEARLAPVEIEGICQTEVTVTHFANLTRRVSELEEAILAARSALTTS